MSRDCLEFANIYTTFGKSLLYGLLQDAAHREEAAAPLSQYLHWCRWFTSSHTYKRGVSRRQQRTTQPQRLPWRLLH